MKKLLYLYNDGHRAFPQLGRGGLGYKPPIKIIGDGLHRKIDEDGNIYYIDDDNRDDTNIYDQGFILDKDETGIDENPYDVLENYVKSYPNAKEVKKGKTKEYYDYADKGGYIKVKGNDEDAPDKMIHVKRDRTFEMYPGVDVVQEEEDDYITDILLDIEIDEDGNSNKLDIAQRLIDLKEPDNDNLNNTIIQLLKDSVKEPYLNLRDFYTIYGRHIPEKFKKDLPELNFLFNTSWFSMDNLKLENEEIKDRGVAFEKHMLSEQQNLLKTITNTNEDFKDNDVNPHFFTDGDLSKPEKIEKGKFNGDPKYTLAIYDAYNNDAIIEFKWNEYDDACNVQVGKFVGNDFFQPVYIESETNPDNLVFYNVYDIQKQSFVYPTNPKSLSIVARLDNGLYSYDIVNLINTKGNDGALKYAREADYGTEKTPITSKDGKQLYMFDGINLKKDNLFKITTRKGSNDLWFILKKSDMKKNI